MTQDYTINDAWKDGFETAVNRLMHYMPQHKFNDAELRALANCIALTSSTWKTRDEWYDILRNSYVRITREMYEECKDTYARARGKYKDNPELVKILEKNESELDETWKKIMETGAY